MLKLINNKGALKLTLESLVGIGVGIAGILFFSFIIWITISPFINKDKCKGAEPSLDLLADKVNEVIIDGINRQQLFVFPGGCALVGFSKYGNNVVEKPKECGQNSCLCLCNENLGGSLQCKNKCVGFSEVDNFKEVSDRPEFKDPKPLVMGTGGAKVALNLNVEKQNKEIYIKIYTPNEGNGGEFGGAGASDKEG